MMQKMLYKVYAPFTRNIPFTQMTVTFTPVAVAFTQRTVTLTHVAVTFTQIGVKFTHVAVVFK